MRPAPRHVHGGKRQGVKEDSQWQAKSQCKQTRDRLTIGPDRLLLCFSRKRDIPNQNNIILDALSGIVNKDDCQIAELVSCGILMRRNPESAFVVTATHDI